MTELSQRLSRLRVILSHDWLTGMRGGERVLEVLCRMFPQAPIHTLIADPPALSNTIRRHSIITSWLQKIPGITKHYRYFLPLLPSVIESFRASEADLVISTSHCVAKGLKPPADALHLCYCFTPMRYAWLFYEEYFGRNRLKKMVLSPMLKRLRKWDRAASDRVTRFVTLSRHVAGRIREFYGREADVVYPPVNIDFWKPASILQDTTCTGSDLGNYDLMVSAMVPYKRIDLAVNAYGRSGFPLKIVGTGPLLQQLRGFAGKNICFLGRVPDEQVRQLYQDCRFLVFPGEEDFGIVPVEAQACGRPVVAYGKGGTLETVVENKTGVFFHDQSENALLEAVESAASMKWNPVAIRSNAERFSEDNFIRGMEKSISQCLEKREG